MFLLLAEGATDPAGSNLLTPLFLLLIGAFVYFAMIRPQRKRAADVERLQSSLSVGDDVITIGGLHGRVDAIGDKTVDLEVTADGDVIMRFRRSSIAEVVRPEADVVEADVVEVDDEASAEHTE